MAIEGRYGLVLLGCTLVYWSAYFIRRSRRATRRDGRLDRPFQNILLAYLRGTSGGSIHCWNFRKYWLGYSQEKQLTIPSMANRGLCENNKTAKAYVQKR